MVDERMAPSHASPTTQRTLFAKGLTIRSVMVSVFALVFMAIWIFYHELYCYWGGWFTINNPPNSAMSVLVILAGLMACLFFFRRSLRLTTPELIVVYSSLLIATPIMSDGGWRTLLPTLIGTEHAAQFATLDRLPSDLWPHGANLVQNGRFTNRLTGFTKEGNGVLAWQSLTWHEKKCPTPVLLQPVNTTGKTALNFNIPTRDTHGKTVVIPGEYYLLSLAVSTSDLLPESYYYVTMQADEQPVTTLVLRSDNTIKTFDNGDSFLRIGKTPILIPKTIQHLLHFSIGLNGPGKLAIQDVQFMNIEAAEGSFTGRKVVSEKNLHAFAKADLGNTVVKPDNLFSIAGIKYIFTGLVPWKEWWKPTIIWTSVLILVMLGFLGMNAIMRRHWVENERVSLPVLQFYRMYFGGGIDPVTGKATQPIWRNKVMWIGFACLFPIVMLKGLHFYFSALPTIPTEYSAIDIYFTNPTLRLYFSSMFISIIFSLLSIALLVEKDILFSVWSCYFLFNFFNFFGKTLNLTQYAGYPWQPQQCVGAYLAYASLALLAARKHLVKVFYHIIGRKKIDDSAEPVPYRTAFLLIVVSSIGLIGWSVWTEMGWLTGVIFFSVTCILAIAASKVRAESSAFYHSWIPCNNVSYLLFTTLGGFALFSMKSIIVAGIVGTMVFSIIFLAVSPIQLEMFELGNHFKIRPRDIVGGLLLGSIGGMIIYGVVHLIFIYGLGSENVATNWGLSGGWIGSSVESLHATADTAYAAGQWPPKATAALDVVNNVNAKGIGLGMLITYILALLRNAFVWFPIHPLGYILGSTEYAMNVWFVCFLAWIARAVTERIGGAHAIRRGLTPFAVGMFLACISSVIIFNVVGVYLRLHGAVDVYCRWP